jgi:antitoxin component YwqK of YwqJK toxin-antitoxin module
MRFVVQLSIICGLAVLSAACGNKRVYTDCGICETDVVTQSYVHKYGIEVPEKEWSGRGKNGRVVSTLKTGVVVNTNYVDGFPDGETTYTFPHSGAIEKIEKYEAGQLVMEQEMYPTGNPKRQVQYFRPNRKVITVWYENGTPHYREEFHDNKLIEADYYTLSNQVESKIDDGNGIRTNRDEFGQIISKDKFEHGQMALRTVLYPNGSPQEIIPYYKGKIHGQRKTFLPGGEPKTIEAWSDDKQEGITLVFQNGEKIAAVPYLNGIKNGVEERYKDEHFIVEEVNWKSGKKHGPCYVYIGEDTHLTWYYDGQEVSKRQYDRITNPSPR